LGGCPGGGYLLFDNRSIMSKSFKGFYRIRMSDLHLPKGPGFYTVVRQIYGQIYKPRVYFDGEKFKPQYKHEGPVEWLEKIP
jgi:hypothetical protein